MSSTELTRLTAHEARALMEGGALSSVELTRAVLERIEEVDGRVGAFLTVLPEQAIQQAEAIDRRRAQGEPLSPIAGIPVALKDNMCTQGVRTTCASRILHNFIPPYNATVVNRLEEAGAVLIGKTNLDEFAMGSSTENSAFQVTRNPWNLECAAGGSSGGSTAAVAAGESVLALGSDTGGSIRQPAALCGVVGMKPTYGRVSRYGLIAFASSLDQIGPITRDVQDCALVLHTICGHDPRDSTSAEVPVPDFTAACRSDVRGLRIGVPQEYFGGGVTHDVARAVHAAAGTLAELGAHIEECSLPSTHYGLAAYYILAPAEASSNLARYDGVKFGHRADDFAGHIGLTEKTRNEGFGAEVKQRILIGTYALSAGYYDAYYRRAQQVRTLIRREFDRAFESFDVLLTPTSPTPAFRVGEKADPLKMKLADVCTLPVNMAGLPGISLPCGFANGLPIGLQFIARPFAEELLLRVAWTYEQATGWHRQRPGL